MSTQAHETLRWVGDVDGYLDLLDQTRLPGEVVRIECRSVATVETAIKTLQVRGAPAIGVAAAYGVCIGVQPALGATPRTAPRTLDADRAEFFARLDATVACLAASRPTAVNLFAALNRMRAKAQSLSETTSARELAAALLDEARGIEQEDRAMCRAIGAYGAELLRDGQGVLTHCNAGGLATADYGTALAVFFTAHEQGKSIHVYADETRPLLQGARLTAWELKQRGVPVTLICDSMAAQVMREGRVQAVVVGADRIAANGDAANKIGTYGLAVLARAHGIPFYIAAPITTFDMALADGRGIPIEQRNPAEVTHFAGRPTAPEGVQVYNPAFDVTPAELITALITDRGLIQPVTREQIAQVLGEV